MTPDMLLVFGLLAVTIILFLTDRLSLDLVALLVLLALIFTGALTLGEALAGFSDPIVLMIAGLFIVGNGLVQTGVADALGDRLARVAGTSEVRLLVMTMVVAAVLSAFMSSTGAVAILLPMVVSLAWGARVSPSKLLIPLAYASVVGGLLTLIGTPPNIVVSDQLVAGGFRPFGFFSFTPVGLLAVGLAIGFMVLVGRRLLPERVHRLAGEEGESISISDLAQAYQLSENLFRLRLRMASPLVGMRLDEADLPGRFDVTVLSIQQWPDRRSSPLPAAPAGPDTILSAQDILHVQGAPERVALLARDARMGIVPANEEQGELLPQELGMAEVLLTPRSRLIGQTLVNSRFRDKYRVTVLGVMRLGKLVTGPVGTIELRFGDTLLVQGTWQSISLLSQESHDFVVVGQPAEMARARPAARRAPVALACMVGMLILLAFNIVPNVVAVLLAAVLMVLTGCLSMEDAYKGMNWSSLILLAGMLPMATALQKSGGVQYVANLLTNSLGQWGPLPVMVGLFLLTGFFSQFISNTATTVLVAPIALQAALTLGVAPYAFLMTIAVAASTAFATPIATSSNTLVLGSGGYRFGDFLRVGLVLQVLIMAVVVLVLPLLFPF
jgi:di/tricarboxylate transporter